MRYHSSWVIFSLAIAANSALAQSNTTSNSTTSFTNVTRLNPPSGSAPRLTTASSPPPPSGNQCREYRERKEIHDYTKEELQQFVTALKRLHNTGRSPWEERAFEHNEYAGINHGTSFFLPYHRALLLDVENALRAANPDMPNLTIPYWNWTLVSQTPWTDWILAPDVLGDSNRVNCNNDGCCVNPSPGPGVNGWPYSPRYNDCFRRKFTYNEQRDQGTMHVWARVLDVMNTNKQFPTFTSSLELIHGTAHQWIGGTMNTMWSLLDPVFIIHHSFIDHIWQLWQEQYDPNFRNFGPISINDNITPYNRPVSQYMSSEGICVRYVPGSNKNIPPGPPVTNITAPKPLDNNWINMNNINQTQAFQFERESQEFSSKLQDEVIRAIKDGKQFVPGVGRVAGSAGRTAQSPILAMTSALVAVVATFVIFG